MFPLIAFGVTILLIYQIIEIATYKKSTYYQVTKNPFFSVRFDTGRNGEYQIYKYLKNYERKGARFLFNVYLPKEDGSTTEIDVLMLCSKGVFVFESKNYSGWIFGNAFQKNWYQTLPTGRNRSHKEAFYNPIMQNESHIKHLRHVLQSQVPIYSVVVFSERCTLKRIELGNADVTVIKRDEISFVVSEFFKSRPDAIPTQKEIDSLYSTLYPYTQVSESVKAQHILHIEESLHSQADVADAAYPRYENNVSSGPADPDAPVAETAPVRKCPRCNGDLVLRTATRGKNAGQQFYGCSRYPHCRYTEKAEDR